MGNNAEIRQQELLEIEKGSGKMGRVRIAKEIK